MTLLSVSWLKENQVLKFEIPLLYLLSGVGMLFMVSANNFSPFTFHWNYRLVPLCLAAVRRGSFGIRRGGFEIFLGVVFRTLLFGISLVYGFTGTLSYASIGLCFPLELPAGAMVGMVFILAGLVFKISGVPFHMDT